MIGAFVSRFTAHALTSTKPPGSTPGHLAVQPAQVLLDRADRAAQVRRIRELAGVANPQFERLYYEPLQAYAVFVQALPASEAHHHAVPGGMLDHTLETVATALSLRRGHLLPPDAEPERQYRQQDLWTYVVFATALLHDIGKPLVDQRVELFDRAGQSLGSWNPWVGAMNAPAVAYAVNFCRGRDYRLHERLAPLLARQLLPARALAWLASERDVLAVFLATLAGDAADGGAVFDIVKQADRASVARDLAGPATRVQPIKGRAPSLAARLVTGLRYLLDCGELPLNRPGAAGWRAGDDLWLVSKRALDALRAHLIAEGQTGIPARNERLMDELQQHGILTATAEDRAIWHARVTLGDGWSQELRLLRLPVRRLWPEEDARPACIDGNVVPVTDEVTTMPVEPAQPGMVVESKGDETQSLTPPTAPAIFEADDSVLPTRQARPESVSPPRAETRSTTADAGQAFFGWLREGLQTGRFALNDVHARLHVVDDGLLLVSPAIFKDFDAADWERAQRRFQKLKLHRRTPQGTNIWRYAVEGARKRSRINGLLIPDAERVFGVKLPAANPHLKQAQPAAPSA